MSRKLRRTLVPCALAAVLLAVDGAAIAQDAPQPVERRVFRGMHEQFRFQRDVARVAVGDQKVLTAEVLNSRAILILGRENGRTSLLVWYTDETVESFLVTVQPDLDMLQRALRDIHPGISVEMAPDREAVVLRGTVPDVSHSRAAESAAAAYLNARGQGSGPVVAAAAAGADDQTANLRVSEKVPTDSPIINLIRVERLPLTVEQRIDAAFETLGASEVTVSRLLRGDYPDDERDVLLLRGRVRNQITLSRVLQVVGTMFLGEKDALSDVKVVLDEGGAFVEQREASDTGSRRSASNFTSVSGLSSGAMSSQDLASYIQSNPGRAKGISLGKGRILSFIEVDDLPQVRVGIRIYEVNRTALLQYAPELTWIWSDFTQGSLSPSPTAFGAQGTSAARVGGTGQTDAQNVLGFLADGFTNQLQIAGRNFAVDAVFNLLESRGIARGLANPTITVLSGEDADFSAGGEIPVPESFSPTFGTTTTPTDATPGIYNSVVFRSFGVSLAVRPHVGDDGTVTLELASRVDRPDETLTTALRETTGTDPATAAFESRAIQTTSRLRDGQSLLIGGLITRQASDSATFVPYLEKVPLLGWLFKRYAIKDDDRELVIVINPTVVRDPLAGLGEWVFPNTGDIARAWVDRTLEYGLRDWPQAKQALKGKEKQQPQQQPPQKGSEK